MTDQRFDDLLNDLANEPMNDAPAAKARVWAQLEQAPPAACAQTRADLPAFIAGDLLESRRLLVRDHLSRCAGCRQVLQTMRAPGQVVEMPKFRAPGAVNRYAKWAVAAGLAAVSAWAGRDNIDRWMVPSGPRAVVESVKGDLVSLPAGAKLGEGDVIRTGTGSRAVLRLADGSALEMNERAELSVHSAWSGQTVRLDHGDVILQAAKQRRGRLRVTTRDAEAAVKGTIFAVSTGVVGSLVAVVEGAVEVDRAGTQKKVLKRGERAATNDALSGVDAREAVAWSQNAEQYLALLADLQKIEQAVMNAPSTMRTQSRLLPLLPANPLLYAAAPNVGTELARAIEDRVRESAVMKQMWESPQGKELQALITGMQSVSTLLGDELAAVMAQDPANPKAVYAFALAEVRPGQQGVLRPLLDRQFGGASGFAYQINGATLIVAESSASVAKAAASLGRGTGTPFAAEIQARYQRGTGWIAAVNAASGFAMNPMPAEMNALGLGNTRHLVFEQRPGADNEVLVSFNGARTGIPSWLGAAAPANSALYASAEALVVMSAVTRNPRQAFDELMAQIGRFAPQALQGLREFEQKTGVSVSNDLASALGTDFTVSLETPTLPTPGWFSAAECYRADALEATIKRLVDAANREMPAAQRITLTQENVNGRTWTTLKSGASPALTWTYDRGYWIVSSDRAVATRAIQTRTGGFPLVRSARFLNGLPRGSGVHQSASSG